MLYAWYVPTEFTLREDGDLIKRTATVIVSATSLENARTRLLLQIESSDWPEPQKEQTKDRVQNSEPNDTKRDTILTYGYF